MTLIIVESPTKARTFNQILKGEDYFVYATMGHLRDLPRNKLAIDYGKNYKPDYGIISGKKKTVDQLKKLAKENKEIILATDLDREGESISYHVAYILGYIKEKWPEFEIKDKTLKRIVFHEITSSALKEALSTPQELRTNLVKSQQARRILDRIVGYELSPLLWKKMGKNWLSAGRVQTVALRLIVEREKEIKNFKEEYYYQIYGFFKNTDEIKAKLIKKGEHQYENTYKLDLFDGIYQYTKTDIDKSNVEVITKDLEKDSYKIANIEENTVTRYPPPPFTTSLLQQEAFHKYSFSSKMTMRLAQDLYERGLITYHRTDSFNLSTHFVFKAMDYIKNKYGAEYALEKPRGFRTKSHLAQEAHEAIRPTKFVEELPTGNGGKNLTQNHRKLYQLIFNRAIATQMKEASIRQVKIYIQGLLGYLLESDYQQVLFDGFLRVLNPDFVKKNKSELKLKAGEKINLLNVESQELLTKPPPRYNEASLIKSLEEKGIGRPSTYAPIISLIQSKNYVEKERRYFLPTKLGEAISDYLSTSFPQLFDVNFTANMEESLDKVANGEEEMIKLIDTFYKPFKIVLDERKTDKSVINVEETVKDICPNCGGGMVVRYSRYGKFLACSNYPKCKTTKPFLQFVTGRNCPKCQGRIVVKYSKNRKRFYGCENYPKCDYSSWKLQ